GIHSARGTLIVATDADCRFSPLWIRTIVSFYLLNDARFIAAPVAMTGARNLAGVFQTLDFLCLQGITAAAVHKRFHMMSNGANLAYEKKAFLEVNGFEGIDKIPTGDDMLLMHKIYSRYPDKVFYLKSQDAIVTTDPEKTWRAFFEQRIRWASKAVYYQDKRIFYVLLLVYLLNAGLGVMAIACIWNASWLFLLILLLLAKTIIEYPFVHSIAAFFQQQRLMKFFAVLQPLHILYIIISGWLGKFGSYTWKNRKLK
ncbi:MAG TPA: glycosyltransferase family 2 protein, partial [Flavitalea sp.]|nr:glycosyltransferase family 2 protein [Flavitalea sp.]